MFTGKKGQQKWLVVVAAAVNGPVPSTLIKISTFAPESGVNSAISLLFDAVLEKVDSAN